MRIRQIKPEFFADPDMAALPFRTRLTFIGLWSIADDAGWLNADFVAISGDLYRYDGRKVRERWVIDDLLLLAESGHIEVEPCGHAVIPALTRHQHLAGSTRRVETTLKEHRSRCFPPIPADPRASPPIPALVKVRSGKVSQGNGSVEGVVENDATTETTEFQRKLAAAGRVLQ